LKNIKNQIAQRLARIGVSANFVTFIGLAFAAFSGLLIYKGYFVWAAVAVLASGLLDLLDGAIARAAGNANKFGGILDSSLDRYGDGFIFAGILFYCAEHDKYLYAALAMSALLGSFLISYVRARAECVVEKCRVGFWERGDRLGLLIVSLFANNLPVALWILGVATHGTALFRLTYSHQRLKSGSPRVVEPPGRLAPLYLAKAGVIFLAAVFLRLPFQ